MGGASCTGSSSFTSIVDWRISRARLSFSGSKNEICTSQQSESTRQYGLLDTLIVSSVYSFVVSPSTTSPDRRPREIDSVKMNAFVAWKLSARSGGL